jgi:hypothetical protein
MFNDTFMFNAFQCAVSQNEQGCFTASLADPGCLSRILDPDFYPSRIHYPGSNNINKRRGEKLVVLPFFVAKMQN